MNNSILLISLVILSSCSARQKIIVNDTQFSCKPLEFEISYAKDKKGDLAFILNDTSENVQYLTINFDSGFDDNVKAIINDSLYFDEKLITNSSSGFKGKSINYLGDKDATLTILINNRKCLTTKLNLDYQKLHIYYSRDKWRIAYNNNYVFYH